MVRLYRRLDSVRDPGRSINCTPSPRPRRARSGLLKSRAKCAVDKEPAGRSHVEVATVEIPPANYDADLAGVRDRVSKLGDFIELIAAALFQAAPSVEHMGRRDSRPLKQP